MVYTASRRLWFLQLLVGVAGLLLQALLKLAERLLDLGTNFGRIDDQNITVRQRMFDFVVRSHTQPEFLYLVSDGIKQSRRKAGQAT